MGEVAGEAALASEALHQVVCVAEADLHPRPEHGLGEPLEAAVLLLVAHVADPEVLVPRGDQLPVQKLLSLAPDCGLVRVESHEGAALAAQDPVPLLHHLVITWPASCIELQMKVREDFTSTEKAPKSAGAKIITDWRL